jgi:hypothetical protein
MRLEDIEMGMGSGSVLKELRTEGHIQGRTGQRSIKLLCKEHVPIEGDLFAGGV